ncbi:hypothetical protein QR90_06810 [Deinococcus radiopugnans]|uniref:Uncharacterized protein n=1 Tax=Deinococcus radiopugnans TaxID=57497 RepID=A0A0A7KI58_9DEIO|nr:hypothetical protein [Deinococcus radiopugnans]AIZ44879.1 hypothetical protein QR90_06810 [Deinococcus radiopugnans]
MTQIANKSIVKLPQGVSSVRRAPRSWDEICEFARMVIKLDEQRRPLNTAQTQAITRLDSELRDMQRAGQIANFTLGDFDHSQISVSLVLPDELYRREHMLMLHERLDEALKGLNLYAAVEMDTELSCGESPQAH